MRRARVSNEYVLDFGDVKSTNLINELLVSFEEDTSSSHVKRETNINSRLDECDNWIKRSIRI